MFLFPSGVPRICRCCATTARSSLSRPQSSRLSRYLFLLWSIFFVLPAVIISRSAACHFAATALPFLLHVVFFVFFADFSVALLFLLCYWCCFGECGCFVVCITGMFVIVVSSWRRTGGGPNLRNHHFKKHLGV